MTKNIARLAVVCLALQFLVGILSAQTTPKEITDKFFAILSQDPEKAIDYLFPTNQSIFKSEELSLLKKKFNEYNSKYGKYCGYEQLSQKKAGTSLLLITFCVKYERLPIQLRCIFYKAQDSWQVLYINLDININENQYSWDNEVSLNQGGTKATNYFVSIPYENEHGLIIITIELKGIKRRFAVDTGAVTAISQALFDELQPTFLTSSSITDFNKITNSINVVLLDGLAIGPVVFDGIPTIMLHKNVWFLECFGLDGIIGSNMLRRSIIQISSQDKRLFLTDDLAKLTNVDFTHSSELSFDKQSSPFLTICLGNSQTVIEKVMFDTGALNTLFSMDLKQFEKIKDKGVFEITSEGEGSTKYGINTSRESLKTTPIYRLSLPSIQINQFSLHNIKAEASDIISSLIGAELLTHGIVTLDFRNKHFYFDPFSQQKNVEENEWNVIPAVLNDQLFVSAIFGKEIRNEIAVGERIIAVNGRNTQTIDVCEWINNPLPKDLTNAILTVITSLGATKDVVISRSN